LIEHGPPTALPVDETTAVQHREVLGNGARRHVKTAGQRAGRGGRPQRAEQPGPRRPEQRLDRPVVSGRLRIRKTGKTR